WEADPERLEEVERRLQFLKRLEGKYRKKVDELILYRLTLDEQERKLQQQEEDLGTVEAELQEADRQLREAGRELSKQRQKVAKKLASAAQKELAELGMREAKLEAVLTPIALGDDALSSDVPAYGADQLELTLAANPGEPALPLRRVASGGELS